MRKTTQNLRSFNIGVQPPLCTPVSKHRDLACLGALFVIASTVSAGLIILLLRILDCFITQPPMLHNSVTVNVIASLAKECLKSYQYGAAKEMFIMARLKDELCCKFTRLPDR